MQILKGVNLVIEKPIKDHCTLIERGIDEFIQDIEENQNNSDYDIKSNLIILQRCFELLERKLLS